MQDAKILKLKQGDQFRKDAIFALGNSTTVVGINSPYINSQSQGEISLFNAGVNGSSLAHVADFALQHLIPNHSPSALVLLIAPGMLNVGSDKGSTSLLSNGIRDWLSKSFYTFKYRNNLRDPMTLNSFRKSLLSWRLGFGIVNSWAKDMDMAGYSLLDSPTNSISGGWTFEEMNTKSIYAGELGMDDIETLRKLQKSAENAGAKIIISTVPLPYLNETYRLEIEFLAELLDIHFISGNDAVTSGMYFSDGIHLNAEGALIFSDFMARELLKLNQ